MHWVPSLPVLALMGIHFTYHPDGRFRLGCMTAIIRRQYKQDGYSSICPIERVIMMQRMRRIGYVMVLVQSMVMHRPVSLPWQITCYQLVARYPVVVRYKYRDSVETVHMGQ